MQYGFGVDIGGTTIKIGLFSVDGDLMEKWEIPTNKTDNGKYILTEIADFINRTIETKGIEKSDVMGVGLGVPGPVNKNGFVSVCVNLGWNSLNVEKEFHEISGLPIKVGNDANVAALGEMWQGAGKGYQDVLMVTLGTGVGGGCVLNGQIVSGIHGAGGEIGHMPVRDSVIDPEIIVIGGGVSKAGDILTSRISTFFKEYAFHACKNTPIVLAKLENDAGMYGCVKSLF